MKWFSALLLFWSFATGAVNIRVIGNGGGDLEMRALSFFEEVPLILFVCAQPRNPCALSEEELTVFRTLQAVEHRGGGPKFLDFHQSGDSYSFDFSEERLSIKTGLLEKNLSSAVLIGYAQYLTAEGAGLELKRVADRLFAVQPWSVRSLGLSRGGRLNFIQDTDEATVVFEREGLRQDLTPQILDVLNCSTGGQLLKLSGPRREAGGFKVKVDWRCGAQHYSADLYGSDLGANWSFQVFGVYPSTFSGPELCRRLL